jgi:ferredoxin
MIGDEPLRILLCYFSGTGNTKHVANILAQAFQQRKCNVDLRPITLPLIKQKISISEYDSIGIGYPVHAFNAPKIVFDFIRSLPTGTKKQIFLFRTAGDPLLHAGGTTIIRSILARRGFKVFYERLFIMPANVLYPFNPRLSKQLLRHAESQVQFMAKELCAQKIRLKSYPKWLHYLASAFSTLETEGTTRLFKYYHVNDHCNLCKICLKSCPMENISIQSNQIKYGRDCAFCLRCVYNCPQEAISLKGFNFFLLKEYNLANIIAHPPHESYLSSKTRGYFRHYATWLALRLQEIKNSH